jgi:uncharacterized membrane protein YhhN
MNEVLTKPAASWLPADKIDQVLALLALASATLYLALLGLRPYPGVVILKTSMCVALALWAWRSRQRLYVLALALSAAGDAFLAIDGERLFVPGLASFLATHLLLIVIFARTPEHLAAPPSKGRRIAGLLIPLAAVSYAALLVPDLGKLAVPVILYIAAISGMAVLALRVRALVVPLGAVSFMISDSLISLDKFLWHADWLGPAIWITYALAQLLIAQGMLVNREN